MGKAYPCTFEGCDKVFKRGYQLTKHEVAHVSPESLFYCSICDFTSFEQRNLSIHFKGHTGEMDCECPDTVSVRGPFGSISEERCKFKTNDPSLLTKHRKKVHGHIPATQRTVVPGTFVPYTVPSSVVTTDASPPAIESKPVRTRNGVMRIVEYSPTRVKNKAKRSTRRAKRAALDNPSPSTSQQGVNDHEERANVDSLDTAVPNSVGSSPVGHALSDTQGQSSSAESPGATGTTSANSGDDISMDTLGQSAGAAPSHSVDFGSTTPVAPDQDRLIDTLFNPATHLNQPNLYAEDFTAPPVTATQQHVQNLQMGNFVRGDFMTPMNTSLDGPGIEGWNTSDWDNLWARYNAA